jgi:hypothetical protein
MARPYRYLLERTVLAGLFLCLATAPALGQGVALGLRGGFNNATQRTSGTAGTGTSSRNTFHVGGIFGVGATETFGFQLEGVYSQKGVALDEAGVAGALKLAYIQVPVLGIVIVPTPPSSPITPHFFAGPNFGFEVSCKVADGSGASVGCGTATKGFDFGLLAGVGFTIGKGNMAFLIDVGVDFGLTNIDNTPESGNTARNRTLMASVGFLLPVR